MSFVNLADGEAATTTFAGKEVTPEEKAQMMAIAGDIMKSQKRNKNLLRAGIVVGVGGAGYGIYKFANRKKGRK